MKQMWTLWYLHVLATLLSGTAIDQKKWALDSTAFFPSVCTGFFVQLMIVHLGM